jgi:uncharacterized membrane protein YGL010W
MKKLDELLVDYASYHRTRGNILCHTIGIPLIVYALIALLLLLPLSGTLITAAEIVIVLSFVYYISLDYKLAIAMLVATSLLDVLARWIDNPMFAVGGMVIGWIFQAIGHMVCEKKSPAFFRNLQHLLIGPLFVINEYLPTTKTPGRQDLTKSF